ncbi:hypothetical protein FNV43_RR09605 [Rhamnella rubrinervis]|uniref:Uncharacterized protein n=1 Tax=Rhamnella rubrinervis TaxID=2594499 RepID=A0A8K0HBK3_9ROSA|nr:hypothetical protein FNV43_RR09605 [Rhamnella rubrinervis]
MESKEEGDSFVTADETERDIIEEVVDVVDFQIKVDKLKDIGGEESGEDKSSTSDSKLPISSSLLHSSPPHRPTETNLNEPFTWLASKEERHRLVKLFKLQKEEIANQHDTQSGIGPSTTSFTPQVNPPCQPTSSLGRNFKMNPSNEENPFRADYNISSSIKIQVPESGETITHHSPMDKFPMEFRLNVIGSKRLYPPIVDLTGIARASCRKWLILKGIVLPPAYLTCSMKSVNQGNVPQDKAGLTANAIDFSEGNLQGQSRYLVEKEGGEIP